MTVFVYLAGPMTHTPDRGSDWRDRAAPLLKHAGGHALDPRELEASSMTDEEIVRCDYASILEAQAVLAYVGVPSWGTAMELAFAKQHGIPVVAFGAPDRTSPWLRAHCDSMHGELILAVESVFKTVRGE